MKLFYTARKKEKMAIVLRVFCGIVGDLTTIALISIPTSRTFLQLIIRMITFIIFMYITFELEYISYDRHS